MKRKHAIILGISTALATSLVVGPVMAAPPWQERATELQLPGWADGDDDAERRVDKRHAKGKRWADKQKARAEREADKAERKANKDERRADKAERKANKRHAKDGRKAAKAERRGKKKAARRGERPSRERASQLLVEHRKHHRRMVKIERLAEVATRTADLQLAARVDKLRDRERRRHQRVMTRLERNEPDAGTSAPA